MPLHSSCLSGSLGTSGFRLFPNRYPHHFLPAALLLAASLPSLLTGQESAPDSPPAPAPAAAAQTGGALPSDEAILKRLPEFSTDRVNDLLGIYARLKNEAMVKALTDELRRRDPDGELPRTDTEIMNEAMDLGDEPPSPHEIMENRIDGLVTAQKYTEAIALMEKERSTTFSGQAFPFEIDLGDAYASIGNLSAAREAYARAAADKGASADQKQQAANGLATIAKLEAVNDAYELIRVKKYDAALARSEELRTKYPTDLEVELLYAQALVPNYHYLEALPMLEAIKAKHFKGQPYPAQDALAESLRAVGRFADARAAYEELAADTTVPAHVRDEAIVALREVSQMRTGNISFSGEYLSENEGDAIMADVEISAPVGEGLFAGIRGWAYDVDLSDERSLVQSSGDFLGAIAFVRKYLDDRLTYVEVRAGGGEHDEISWGASYGKESPYIGVLGFDISIDGNIPATDSLQLIALNGIEDKVSASVTLPLPYRFEASAGAWGRRVKADGTDLGEGWGGWLEVGRPLWENVTETSQVYLAYRGDYESFDADRVSARDVNRLGFAGDPGASAIGDDLIEPTYHPHGLQLSYESRVNNQLYFYTSAGLYFDFSDEEWDYNFTGGLDYALTDTISLILEGGYYSDGTGASNDDSEVFVGHLGLRKFF